MTVTGLTSRGWWIVITEHSAEWSLGATANAQSRSGRLLEQGTQHHRDV